MEAFLRGELPHFLALAPETLMSRRLSKAFEISDGLERGHFNHYIVTLNAENSGLHEMRHLIDPADMPGL